MSEPNAEGRQAAALSPQSLRLEDLARILSAALHKPVTVAMLQDDIDDGAPQNADGTMNLVEYVSWLVEEVARAGN